MSKAQFAIKIGDVVVAEGEIIIVDYMYGTDIVNTIGRVKRFDQYNLILDTSMRFNSDAETIELSKITSISPASADDIRDACY